MAQESSLFQLLDSQLEHFLSGWSIYTTVIFIALITYLLYPVFFSPEPDIHPILLANQAIASRVRNPGESAIFRSPETPHGYPLRSGLNVKDPGSPKWTAGRDGNLTDVWKQALRGPLESDENAPQKPGKVLTILGKEKVIELELAQLNNEINAVGTYLKSHAGCSIAIYLPNSVEFLVTFFAAIFHGFTPVLISQGFSAETIARILEQTHASILIAGAGAIPLKEVMKHYSGLKQVVWVVERTSRHMDWNEIPEGVGGKAEIAVWHEIVNSREDSPTSHPTSNFSYSSQPNVISVYKKQRFRNEGYEVVEFTQKNIVAAIGAQISVLPAQHRFKPVDLLLPLEPLSKIWALTLTLAALFSNSSLALTSVAGPKVNYNFALQNVSPTIVLASSVTMARACTDGKVAAKDISQKFKCWMDARSLTAGVMPKNSGTSPVPRLVYIFYDASAEDPPLGSDELFYLRVLTGSRLIYSLVDPKVAGAIAQTNVYDYQMREGRSSKHAHFGPPLSSVEVKLKEPDKESEEDMPIGWLVVEGPAVVGGTTKVDQMMTITDSNTLCYSQ